MLSLFYCDMWVLHHNLRFGYEYVFFYMHEEVSYPIVQSLIQFGCYSSYLRMTKFGCREHWMLMISRGLFLIWYSIKSPAWADFTQLFFQQYWVLVKSDALRVVKHDSLVSPPFESVIHSKWVKNSLKLTIIRFFRFAIHEVISESCDTIQEFQDLDRSSM